MIIFKSCHACHRWSLNAAMHFMTQKSQTHRIKCKSAGVCLRFLNKSPAQKDMQHTSMNWHLLNIPNHLKFVMAIPLSASPILHVTCYAYVLLIWILWHNAESRRDLSQWDSLEFSIHIPTSSSLSHSCSFRLQASSPFQTSPKHI